MLKPGNYNLALFYEGPAKSPYLNWLTSLDPKMKERISDRVGRMEKGQFGDYKKIDRDLYELRLFFGPGYRVYFGERGSKLILLLTGGDKSSQNRDIAKARQYWKTFQEDNP